MGNIAEHDIKLGRMAELKNHFELKLENAPVFWPLLNLCYKYVASISTPWMMPECSSMPKLSRWIAKVMVMDRRICTYAFFLAERNEPYSIKDYKLHVLKRKIKKYRKHWSNSSTFFHVVIFFSNWKQVWKICDIRWNVFYIENSSTIREEHTHEWNRISLWLSAYDFSLNFIKIQ